MRHPDVLNKELDLSMKTLGCSCLMWFDLSFARRQKCFRDRTGGETCAIVFELKFLV